MGLLIQQVNAQHSDQYNMVANYCMQQGDTAIENLIKLGILEDRYAKMTCEQVIVDLEIIESAQAGAELASDLANMK